MIEYKNCDTFNVTQFQPMKTEEAHLYILKITLFFDGNICKKDYLSPEFIVY